MAWDAAHQRVVLFGGRTPGWANLSDTWEWDGTNWVEKTPATSPTARRGHAMAWDGARQRVVLFGGGGADTWEWDGVTWTLRTPATAPPVRSRHAMAWNESRQLVRCLRGGGTSATSRRTSTSAVSVKVTPFLGVYSYRPSSRRNPSRTGLALGARLTRSLRFSTVRW